MDYRLIKENFDKATAELEDTGTLAQQGEPAFAVGDTVTFSSAYTGRRMREARGKVTGVEWEDHVLTSGPMYPPRSAYIYTVEWDNYKPLASGGKPRSNIGKYYDFELELSTGES